MKDVIKELAIWGCDVNSALERFGDDRDLYKECLGIFVDDNNFTDLEKALENKDVEAAFSSAHALKGVAGNLSLGNLYDSICRVSDSLKRGDLETALVEYPDVKNINWLTIKLLKNNLYVY